MTLKTIVLLLAAASVSAFAPVNTRGSRNVVCNAFAGGLVGGEGPERPNFDPVGFAERSPESLLWFRESELKHGRIAMLAVLGMVVPEFIRVPGEQFSFEAVSHALDAHDKLPQSMIQIFGWISFLESCTWAALANMNNFDRKPGEYGFDPLNLWGKDEEKRKRMEIAELKNGRLAMIAIGGMVHGAIVTGKGFPFL